MKNCLKILSPIDKLSEADPLIKAGADEFYCGLVLDNLIIGGRKEAGCVFSNLEQLQNLIDYLHQKRKKVFLTINAPRLSKKEFTIIHRNIKKIRELNSDGLIVANLKLFLFLKKIKEKKIIASSFLGVANKESAVFMKKLGAKRIILDKSIELRDLTEIKAAVGDVELEVFGMNVACRNLSYCCNNFLALISIPFKKKLGILKIPHFCLQKFKVQSINGQLLPGQERLVATRLSTVRNSCGMCSLFRLAELGVTSLKVVGRGGITENKIKSVLALAGARMFVESSNNLAEHRQKSKLLFQKIFNRRCNKRDCYYPHFS